jgi:hypothetical protein
MPATNSPCVSRGEKTSIAEIVDRVENQGVRYLFVGESHAVGPAKRFAVDSANALVERGHDVGLYVEGFRTDCAPSDVDCRSLAQLFNRDAFLTLLARSRAPVHAIDPPEADLRVERMVRTIAAGTESIRVVLVGRSHVVYAGVPDAELWVYGGHLRYPDPGDLAEAFPRQEYLTFSLEAAGAPGPPYSLRLDGCRADYALVTEPTGTY